MAVNICSFVLELYLLPIPLPSPWLKIQSGVPAVHVLFLPCNSARLRILLQWFCFVLYYPLINQILLLSSIAFPLPVTCYTTLSHSHSVPPIKESHSQLYCPSRQFQPTKCCNPIGWKMMPYTAHTLPYVKSVLGLSAFWTLKVGRKGAFLTSSKCCLWMLSCLTCS
jgi:hypothetical protein